MYTYIGKGLLLFSRKVKTFFAIFPVLPPSVKLNLVREGGRVHNFRASLETFLVKFSVWQFGEKFRPRTFLVIYTAQYEAGYNV